MENDENLDHRKVAIQVDKTWLIGIVVALIVQIFSGVWWASNQAEKLNNIDIRMRSLETQLVAGAAEVILRSEKMVRLDASLDNLKEANSKVEQHLAIIEGYLHTQSRKN